MFLPTKPHHYSIAYMSQELLIWIFGLDKGESHLGQKTPLFSNSIKRNVHIFEKVKER